MVHLVMVDRTRARPGAALLSGLLGLALGLTCAPLADARAFRHTASLADRETERLERSAAVARPNVIIVQTEGMDAGLLDPALSPPVRRHIDWDLVPTPSLDR